MTPFNLFPGSPGAGQIGEPGSVQTPTPPPVFPPLVLAAYMVVQAGFVGDERLNVCTFAEAQAQANEINSATGAQVTVSEVNPGGDFPAIPLDTSDPRRFWRISAIPGTSFSGCYAQALISAKSLNGVGAPGRWGWKALPQFPNGQKYLTWIPGTLADLAAQELAITVQIAQLQATLTALKSGK